MFIIIIIDATVIIFGAFCVFKYSERLTVVIRFEAARFEMKQTDT